MVHSSHWPMPSGSTASRVPSRGSSRARLMAAAMTTQTQRAARPENRLQPPGLRPWLSFGQGAPQGLPFGSHRVQLIIA